MAKVGIETAEGEGEEEGSGLLQSQKQSLMQISMQSLMQSLMQSRLRPQSWLRTDCTLGCRVRNRYGDEF